MNATATRPPAPVNCTREPSDAAWKHAGDVAARILENLAERDLRAAALDHPAIAPGTKP